MNKTVVAQQAKTESFLPSAMSANRVLQRKCACGNQTLAGGECAECGKKKLGLQRKLTVGASNDPLEREADRVADQVMAMSMSAPSATSKAPLRIQRYAGQASESAGNAPASVDRVLASSGRPLEPTLRQDMEQRFGHDFSQVRVHSGAAAEQSAREVSANAYTAGNNIVFAQGQFVPRVRMGRRLIAHELTHVVQQRRANGQHKKTEIQRSVCTDRPYSEDCSRYVGSGSSSCEFYRCREANNECSCGSRGYYMGYGFKYCSRFNRRTRSRLSRAGQRWLDQTTRCLQAYIDNSIPWDAPCDVVKNRAFSSHPSCYVRSGICFLSTDDWALILATIDASDNDLGQVIKSGVSCIANWVPLAFPVHSLSAGGGFRGLMDRDRRRQMEEMRRPRP